MRVCACCRLRILEFSSVLHRWSSSYCHCLWAYCPIARHCPLATAGGRGGRGGILSPVRGHSNDSSGAGLSLEVSLPPHTRLGFARAWVPLCRRPAAPGVGRGATHGSIPSRLLPNLPHRREISGVVASVCSHIIVLLHFAFPVCKALVLLN